MSNNKKRYINIFVTALLILFIPLIASQFTEEIDWSLSDFLVASALVLGSVTVIEVLRVVIKKKPLRVALSLLFLAIIVLFWLELAVGIFGSPLAGS